MSEQSRQDEGGFETPELTTEGAQRQKNPGCSCKCGEEVGSGGGSG